MNPEDTATNMPENRLPRLGLLGLGAAGGHVLEHLNFPPGIIAWYMDTDHRSLQIHKSPAHAVLLGEQITCGLSSGGDSTLAEQAAKSNHELLLTAFKDLDLLFVFLGFAGGTGGGAVLEIAKAAQESATMVIVFGFMPFAFEGKRRQLAAEELVSKLRQEVAAVIKLPNEQLIAGANGQQALLKAFTEADRYAKQFLETLWQNLHSPAYAPFDLNLLRRVFQLGSGRTLFSIGYGKGPEALQSALSELTLCPLLHMPGEAHKADRLLLMIEASEDFSVEELNQLSERITEQFSATDELYLGLSFEKTEEKWVKISILGMTDTQAAYPNHSKLPLVNQHIVAAPSSSAYEEPKRKKKVHPRQQSEFNFDLEKDQRGFFSKTSSSTFNGEDLDVPTYLRRNIKLKL